MTWPRTWSASSSPAPRSWIRHRIDESIFGNANGAGEENRNVARMATLLAGLPTSLPGTTMNRLCGSSLDAAIAASRQINTGDADLVLVGGVESMSRAPWVLPKTERALPDGQPGTGQHHPGLAPGQPGHAQGMDSLPGRGHRAAARKVRHHPRGPGRIRRQSRTSWPPRPGTNGKYDNLVVSVPPANKRGTEVTMDETIRAGSTAETLAGLRTVFRDAATGTVTAGNASPMSDGASAAFIGSERGGELLGAAPLARIAGRASSALDPQYFGFAPVEAANKALAKAGIGWADVAAVELNEAFAAQSLACVRAWDIDAGHRQRLGRRAGHRPPAGRLRPAHPGHPGPPPAGHQPALGRRRDLHRRRPGPGRRAGKPERQPKHPRGI